MINSTTLCVRVCAGMEGRKREPKGTPLLILILFVRERMFAHNNWGGVIRIEILSMLPCAHTVVPGKV